MKMRVRSMLIRGACISLFAACRQHTSPQAVEGAYPLMTLQPEDRQLSVKYPAVIEGKHHVEVRPQGEGMITQACVEERVRVCNGQVLFVINMYNALGGGGE